MSKRWTWTEDDCTCSDPDHETWPKAYKRLAGEPWRMEDIASETDGGDGTMFVMKNGAEVWSSYPGGSAIQIPEKVHVPAT